MTTPDPTPHNNEGHQLSNDYPPFLPENETEVARLLIQHRQLSEFLGDILPSSLDLSSVNRILDVACGVGSWVLDMARKHPTMQIIGIDKSQYFIEQARTMALSEHVPNATFILQDTGHLESDSFTPASFDLINIRFIAAEFTPQEFPPLLQSLAHLSRPGGIIHWLEAELPVTNSPACERLAGMVLQGLKATGRTFSPSNNSLGITACMAGWFHSAGCRTVQDIAHAIDVSAWTTAHTTFFRQAWIFGHQVQPFLLATGVTTLTEFEEVFQRTQKEISADTFCGICFLREVVAAKLREGERLEVFRR